MTHRQGVLSPRTAGRNGKAHKEVPFLRCSLRMELIREDFPTLGTPITMMQYSTFWNNRKGDG